MVLVFSCGRTGTNLVLEILTGNPLLIASNPPEDKLIFHRSIRYPDNYLTKCDTVYCKSYKLFDFFMKNNFDSKIIWTIRDPRDMILSKLYRGWNKADDGNPHGCLNDMFYMYYLHKRATKNYDNIIIVKMEDVILDINNVVDRLCNFINIPVSEEMIYPHLRMRHTGKKERYNTLDKSQIGIWNNYKDSYNGFFKDKVDTIEDMFKIIDPLIDYFGYRR